MANRSDTFTATLPRRDKKQLAMAEAAGHIRNSHERGSLKRSMLEAHKSYVRFKLKRSDAPVEQDSDEG
jgi:hypothetical protein